MEGALFSFLSSTRALSHIGAGLSGRHVGEEEVNFDEVEVVYSENPGMVEPKGTRGDTNVEPVV